MKYILFSILIILILSWFIPIVPQVESKTVCLCTLIGPCPRCQEKSIKFKKLSEIINKNY